MHQLLNRDFSAADRRFEAGASGRQRLLSRAFALAVTRLSGARPDLLEIKDRARRIVALMDRSPRFGEWAAEELIRDPSRSVDESIGLAELLVAFVETEVSPLPAQAEAAGVRPEPPQLFLSSDGFLRLPGDPLFPGDARLTLEGMLDLFPGQDVTVRVSGVGELRLFEGKEL